MNKIKLYIRYMLVVKALGLTRTKNLDNWILHSQWTYSNNVRQNGKTVASLLRLIVYDEPLFNISGVDIDYLPYNKKRYCWYVDEYNNMLHICQSKWWWKVFWKNSAQKKVLYNDYGKRV